MNQSGISSKHVARVAMRSTVVWGLIVPLCLVCAQAKAVIFLQDGEGFWWDIDPNGSVRDGSDIEEESTDAFDSAMRLAIFVGAPPTFLSTVTFPESSQTTELGGRIVVTGPETLSGLIVTRRAYVPDTTGEGWACFLEYLENPSTEGVAVTVRIVGNVGSDGNTTVTASSSGDTAFGPDDRWVASDDAHNGTVDPSLNFNYWGVGAAIAPTDVLLPASQDDYYVDFPVIVPPSSTVILMHFCGQNADDAAAASNAAYLDGLPSAALVGLNAGPSAPVINWNVSPDLDVSPSDLSAFDGDSGGPFTPASYSYTLTNNGAGSLNWSSSAPAWLTVLPASGTGLAGGGGFVTITASLNTAVANAMSPGAYYDAVLFSDDTNGVDILRTAELMIHAQVEITPVSVFEIEGPEGGPFSPEDTTYTLTNVTASPIDWSMTGPAWLDIAPNTGTLGASPSSVEVTVSVNTGVANGLAVGGYSDILTFSNDSLSPAVTQVRDVELYVQDTVYVDGSLSAGTNDGSSWSDAFHGADAIQNAVDAAAPSHSVVWVAEGIYTENVTLAEGVTVYGGFSNGDVAVDRDPETKETVMDGNDAGSVVTIGAIRNAGIDGFTLTGGYGTSGGGGGVRCAGTDGTCLIAGCIIENNRSVGRGAGIYCLDGAAPEISDCWIIGNVIDLTDREFGGGICCAFSEPTIVGCVVAANEGRYGAGIGCIQCSPTITNCLISGNLARNTGSGGSGGGGIFAHDHSSPAITNCVISGNHAQDWAGGGVFCQNACDPLVTNCTISSDSCNTGGGGVHAIAGGPANVGSAPILNNCILEGMVNDAVREDAEGTVAPLVTAANCLFYGNAPFDFRDNGTTGYTGGDAINANVENAHDNVWGNPAPQFAGGITGAWNAEPLYDALTNRTALTAAGAPFSEDLRGRLINADTTQSRQAFIVESTVDTVYVVGDVTAASGPLGYVSRGDAFCLLDYHLNGNSPAVNVGDDGAPNVLSTDIEGNGRVGAADLGAYECATPSGATVVSIVPSGDSVTSDETADFIVTFSRGVANVDTDDFVLTGLDGQVDATIQSVTGNDHAWVVTVNTGTGAGSLHIDLVDNSTITDILGLPLAGGDFTTGIDLEFIPMPVAGALALCLLAGTLALRGAAALRGRS